jgi:putative adhesin
MMKLAHIPAIAVLGIVALSTPAVAREQKETERVDRTVSIRSGGQLRLKNFSGTVTITGGSRGDISVHAIRRADRDRLDHIKLEIVETGSGVTIDANKKDSDWHERDNNVVDTELDIQVPDDVTLDVQVFSSDVKIVDVRGRQRVHTFSGDVDVAGAAGSVDAETFSGDITVRLAQSAGGHLDFDSFSGSLQSDVPMLYRSGSRRRIQGDIGSGNNEYHFKTFSGDVRIR